jgi:hypothetical protein
MSREQLELLYQFLISLGQPNSEPNLGQFQLEAFGALIEEYNQGSRSRLHLLQLAQEVGLPQEGLAKLREVAWTLDLDGTQDWEFHPF